MDYTKILGTALVGALVLNTTTSSLSFATNSIEIYSLNSEISSTDSIFITGFVSVESFYKPVRLEVHDPNGTVLYNPYVNFNEDGQFSWLFHAPQGKFDVPGTYTIIATHEDVSEISQIQFRVIEEKNSDIIQVRTSGGDPVINSGGYFASNEIGYIISLLLVSFAAIAIIWKRSTYNVKRSKKTWE